MKRSSMLAVLGSAILVWTGGVAAQEGETETLQMDQRVQRRSDAFRAQQAVQADQTEEVLPHFALDDRPELVLTSAVDQIVEVTVVARFSDGRALPLGQHLVAPSRHTAVGLTQLIETADPAFLYGSLWISYIGTPESIQAWVVSRIDSDATEFPLVARSDNQSRHYVSFWGRAPSRSGGRLLHVLNTSPKPLRYAVWSDAGPRRWREIGAERSHTVVLGAAQRAGWVQIEHQGEPGDLVAQVTTVSSRAGGKVPVWPLPAGYGREFEALRLDLLRGSRVSTILWNNLDESQTVVVAAKDWASGVVISRTEVSVAPKSVQELLLPERDHQQRAIRLQVSAEKAGLVVHAIQEMPGGELSEIAFVDHRYAHASGSYPVLPVAQFDTRLSLVNLGMERAEIVAQLYWDEGSYAIGPLIIEPASSAELSVREMIENGPRDLLGRRPAHELRNGFLKWKVHRGSRALLGRTEAIDNRSGDRIGFNCLGCCWEAVWGGVEPAHVEFFVGETPSFVSWVAYETCNGPMGPFEQPPEQKTVPAPFNWNGSTVSASSAAEAALSFLNWGEEVSSTCSVSPAPYGGSGVADGCKTLLRKSHNPLQSWSTSQACTTQAASESSQRCSRCSSCCTAQRNYWSCKKKSAHIVTSEYNTCITHCTTDHCS
jgi:hypothetical protein